MRNYLTLAIMMLAAWIGPAAGAVQGTPPPAKPGEDFPLHIIASKLEADQNAGIATFTGKVKATYGESILYADQLRVYFIPKKPPGAQTNGAKGAAAGTAPGTAAGTAPGTAAGTAPGTAAGTAPRAAGASPLDEMGGDQIDHIVATGQVRYVQEDRVATGQEATYYKNRNEVVLVGNPQVWQKENSLKGERIIFNLTDNTMRAESSPQKRVEANLYPAKQPGPGGQGASPLPAKPRKDRRP
ncbi:MAG: LptA/OstA family protein [Desulfobaccales bacterium]